MRWPVSIRMGVAAALMCASAAGVAAPPASAQDAVRGEYVFRKCALCHVVDPNAKDLLAPPLHNIIGRRAGLLKGFDYSDIMKIAGQKGLVWTTEALNYFLDRPEDFMPGTYMAFAGIEDQERRDVIAYLEKISRDFSRLEQTRRASPPPRPAPAQQPSSQQPSWQPSKQQPRQFTPQQPLR